MDDIILSSTDSEARQAVFDELSATWSHEVPVSLTASGSIFLQMNDNPVLCRFPTLPLGYVLVEIESPVLLDFVPPPDFYELISVSQIRLGFGSLIVAAGEEVGQIMVAVSAKLFADGLTAAHLKRAIQFVHRTALEQIQILENVTPPLGGRRAYA